MIQTRPSISLLEFYKKWLKCFSILDNKQLNHCKNLSGRLSVRYIERIGSTAEQKAIKKDRCNYLHGHDTRIHASVYTVSGGLGELTVKEVEMKRGERTKGKGQVVPG